MTPDQIDGFINAWVWIDSHGPELAGAAVAAIPVCCMPRIARRTLARQRGLRRLEQYANHPGSRPILDDFHQPRKEKP